MPKFVCVLFASGVEEPVQKKKYDIINHPTAAAANKS
jgi:hypothetical protein